jgi:Na+/H+ antiporter NhaD/arsenite permease-like protein
VNVNATTLAGIFATTLLAQALLPSMRLVIVLSGAALSVLATTALGAGTAPQVLADVPYGVLLILAGLGLLAEMLGEGQVFGPLAVRVARATEARPRRLRLAFCALMYAVSGLVNNLTALVLVLPVILVLLRTGEVRAATLRWTLGALLVACNLGGAATPIGDFPAILLLSRGSMTFGAYLTRALPTTAAALLALFALVEFGVRPERDAPDDPLARRLSLAVVEALHRGIRPRPRPLVPSLVALAAMLIAWSALPPRWGVSPDLVCWLGVCGALLWRRTRGESLLRTRFDAEPVLFLFALFVMVAAVRRAGLFEALGGSLLALPLSPTGRLAVFLLASGLLTGMFSAGPGMAALLDVAARLAETLPPHAVYVGLALSVCAGSSLFLTAATSGPLAQSLVERAELRAPDGTPLRFGFREFLPVGLAAFAVIQGTALLWALLAAR